MNNKGSAEAVGPTWKASRCVCDSAVRDVVQRCTEPTTSRVLGSTWSYRCEHSKKLSIKDTFSCSWKQHLTLQNAANTLEGFFHSDKFKVHSKTCRWTFLLKIHTNWDKFSSKRLWKIMSSRIMISMKSAAQLTLVLYMTCGCSWRRHAVSVAGSGWMFTEQSFIMWAVLLSYSLWESVHQDKPWEVGFVPHSQHVPYFQYYLSSPYFCVLGKCG